MYRCDSCGKLFKKYHVSYENVGFREQPHWEYEYSSPCCRSSFEEVEEIEIEKPEETEVKVNIGDEVRIIEFDGGYTIYKVIRITKDRKRCQTTERWFNVDGYGKRPASWHDISVDNNGNEKIVF